MLHYSQVKVTYGHFFFLSLLQVVSFVCVYVFSPRSQGNSLSGGLGVYQVWTGLVLENTDPLCDPLAAVFGKISITLLLNYCDRRNYWQFSSRLIVF